MRSGLLRHRVEIQSLNPSADAVLQQKPNPVTVQTVPASVEALSGRKAETARHLRPDATHEIGFRYPGFTVSAATHRIKWGSRIFNILFVHDVGELRRDIVVTAVESPGGV